MRLPESKFRIYSYSHFLYKPSWHDFIFSKANISHDQCTVNIYRAAIIQYIEVGQASTELRHGSLTCPTKSFANIVKPCKLCSVTDIATILHVFRIKELLVLAKSSAWLYQYFVLLFWEVQGWILDMIPGMVQGSVNCNQTTYFVLR